MLCVLDSGKRGMGKWAWAISRKRSSSLSMPSAAMVVVWSLRPNEKSSSVRKFWLLSVSAASKVWTN